LPPLKQLARLSSFPWTGLRPAIVDSPGPNGPGPYCRTPLSLCIPCCKVLLVPGGGLAGGWALACEGSSPSPSARISPDNAAPLPLFTQLARRSILGNSLTSTGTSLFNRPFRWRHGLLEHEGGSLSLRHREAHVAAYTVSGREVS
jgi:hypothetical protein